MPDGSVNLIVTSPPFPLTFQKRKPYESVAVDRYVDWFLEFGNQFRRVLKDDGSLVIDIGGVWNKGTPTRSLYQYHLLLGLCEKVGFHLRRTSTGTTPGLFRRPPSGSTSGVSESSVPSIWSGGWARRHGRRRTIARSFGSIAPT